MKKLYVALCAAVAVLFTLNLFLGSVSIPAGEVLSILLGDGCQSEAWRFIVVESRLPQAITAMLCGSALAVSGLMLQTAFHNPLAGPSVFGITSGASLGAAVVMLALGGGLSIMDVGAGGYVAVMTGAFIGAMAVMALIFLFSTLVGSNVMVLIIGIMIGYLVSSATTLLNFFASEEGVRSFMLWGMGTFGDVGMSRMLIFSLLIVAGLFLSALLIKPLNALLLGETYAESLGIDTVSVRNRLLLATGLLVAVSTAFCGPISFIGLAVPHMARLLLPSDDHRQLLPATLLMGAAVALLCCLLSALPWAHGLLPLNAITPLIGAPVIVYVIMKGRR